MSPKLSSSRGGALIWIGAVVLLLAVAAVLIFDRVLRRKYEPAVQAFRQELTANVDFFCEQQTKLSADPWFHEARTEGDAGPLLNKWLAWEPQTEPPEGSPLKLPATLPDRAAPLGDWIQADLAPVDFSWMKTLRGYDRWDLLGATRERIDWVSWPFPRMIDLQLWARLRLAHGVKSGEPLEAAADVRHLAWLCYRTDTLLGGALAASILRLERQAWEAMPAPPPEWKPMSHEQAARMRAVVMSGPAFSTIGAPAEVATRARNCGTPPVGRCAALVEAGSLLKLLQPLAKDDYREIYAAHERDVSAKGCATSLPAAIWERGLTLQERKPTPGEPEWLQTPQGRYLGDHLAGILVAIATPQLTSLRELKARLASGELNAPAK